MNKIKTRNLSPAEYLETLLSEYFCCLLKKNIHKSIKNISYYQKVADYKIETINDLCSRKLMPNPLDNKEELKNKMIDFYKKLGISHLNLSTLEELLYFSKNNDFVFKQNDVEFVGKLVDYLREDSEVIVKDLQGKIFHVPVTDVRRIF